MAQNRQSTDKSKTAYLDGGGGCSESGVSRETRGLCNVRLAQSLAYASRPALNQVAEGWTEWTPSQNQDELADSIRRYPGSPGGGESCGGGGGCGGFSRRGRGQTCRLAERNGDTRSEMYTMARPSTWTLNISLPIAKASVVLA